MSTTSGSSTSSSAISGSSTPASSGSSTPASSGSSTPASSGSSTSANSGSSTSSSAISGSSTPASSGSSTPASSGSSTPASSGSSTPASSGSSTPASSGSSTSASSGSPKEFDSDAAAPDNKKYYRERLQLDEVPRRIFVQEYRMNHAKMRYIAELVRRKLAPEAMTNKALSLEQRVAVCVRLLATGSFQNVVGSAQGCSAQSVSLYFKNFLDGMLENVHKVIYFPLDDKEWLKKTSEQFELKGRKRGLFGIIGSVDGTLVKIKTPAEDPDSFRCRGGKDCAINAQFVVGPDKRVLDVCASNPGANHDSFVFDTCYLRDRLEDKVAEGNFPYCLAGDKGYRATRLVAPPYRNPNTPQKRAFNQAHQPKRLIAEHVLADVKNSYKMIDKTGGHLCYSPGKCSKIIVVAAMLHNIRRFQEYGDGSEPSSDDSETEDSSDSSSSDSAPSDAEDDIRPFLIGRMNP